MKKKTKLSIVAFILLLGGIVFWKWNSNKNDPKIETKIIDQTTKEVSFKMSYKDMKFESTVKHGGLRRQPLNGYEFEAITKENTIVFSIKSEDGNVLATKTVSFNG